MNRPVDRLNKALTGDASIKDEIGEKAFERVLHPEREIARLRAINAQLLEALKAVEWEGRCERGDNDTSDCEDRHCASCGLTRAYGHGEKCAISAAVRAAEGE